MAVLIDKLPPVTPRVRRPLRLLWLGLLLLTFAGQVGGLWYATAVIREINPAFAAVGMETDTEPGHEGIFVSSRRPPGIPKGSRIERIDGVPLASDATELEASRRLAGPEGSRVTVHVRSPRGEVRAITITRDGRANAGGLAKRKAFAVGTIILVGLLGLTYVGGAFMLWRRRPEDPVSTLLSFAFLAIAGAVGPLFFWQHAGLGWLAGGLIGLWLALMIIAFAAFPDGRFVPRWSRWALVLGPLVGLSTFFDDLPKSLGVLLLVGSLIFSLGALVWRYRRTPAGQERQQFKWAAFGLVGGMVLLMVSIAAILILAALEVQRGPVMAVIAFALVFLLYAGFLMIPLGVMLSLLRYRLNDADAAIGRSTGYAAVTAVVGAVWAMSAYWVQEMLPDVVGQENKGLATAVAGLVAVGIFAPVRSRLLRWAEGRFQRALVRLRGLPVRLAQLQHGDDPGQVAEVALEALERGIETSASAIVDERGERLAARGEEGPYLLSVDLVDASGPVAVLKLGARSDGAAYTRDQRAAVATILPPLADALRATSRRGRDKATLAATLAAIEQRLAGLERRSGTAAEGE